MRSVQVHLAEHALDTCLLAQLRHLMALLLPARCCGTFSVLRANSIDPNIDSKNDAVIHLREASVQARDDIRNFKAKIFEVRCNSGIEVYRPLRNTLIG